MVLICTAVCAMGEKLHGLLNDLTADPGVDFHSPDLWNAGYSSF